MLQSKQCTKCKQWKPLDEFSHEARAKDGYRSQCKECRRKQDRAYYEMNAEKIIQNVRNWRLANPEKYKEYERTYGKEYRDAHKEETAERVRKWRKANPDRFREQWRRYRATHQEELSERAKRYYAEDPEKFRERSRIWRQNNPDKHREQEQKRRARKAALEDDLTNEDWETVLGLWEYCCAYCGKSEKEFNGPLQQEHVIPVSQGGGYILGNIVPSCPECNYRKSSRTPSEAGMVFISEAAWQEQQHLVELRGDMRNPPPLSL